MGVLPSKAMSDGEIFAEASGTESFPFAMYLETGHWNSLCEACENVLCPCCLHIDTRQKEPGPRNLKKIFIGFS